MGRHNKTIFRADVSIDARESGYYSTPSFVGNFIATRLLELKPDGKSVFDPAVGKEELLSVFIKANKTITSFDIEQYLQEYKSNFSQQNFIDYFLERPKDSLFSQSQQEDFDYYIANPPYNCHEVDYIKQNKNKLKAAFKDVGVLNLYSMFITALIDISKEGSLIGLITYDSFLHNTLHKGLRNKILSECSIHDILLCPSDLFIDQKADIRTVILILQKGKQF